jgi:diguanylate cyclase (GGDEF)-like protein
MDLDPLALIRALFSRVLLCDAEGRVVEAIGDGAPENVLSDPMFARLREPLAEALAGTPFEASIPFDGGDSLRLRAIPLPPEGRVRLIVALEPETHPAARLRYGGLETNEVAFLVRHMRQGLWRLDAEERIVEANEYVAAWLETTIEELVGSVASRWRLEHPDDARYEAEFVTAAGMHRRGLVIRSDVVSPAGHRLGAVEILTDVTAEHALKAKLVEEVRRMSQLARTDALTGLPNRMVFEERLAELRAAQDPFAVILVDLDDLKTINDARGHACGDQAIVEIGERIRDSLRANDLVARIGGDEFAVLLPATDRGCAQVIAERLRRSVAEPTEVSPVRASLGLAHSDDGRADITQTADEAMYRHKRSRRAND